jgi:hypothetical protein
VNIATADPWLEPPLRRFIDEARARLALLLHPSGQVMAQTGFTRAIDVMSGCALAAAIAASAGELGQLIDGKPFVELHHPGTERQLYLGRGTTPAGAYILLTVFDDDSSLGLVRFFADRLRRELIAAAPAASVERGPLFNADFERDLNRSIATLFGGEPTRRF